jgi:hypothetical protein
MGRPSKKLEKVHEQKLLEEQSSPDFVARSVNEKLFEKIRKELVREYPNRLDEAGKNVFDEYDPVVEMAKFAVDPLIDNSLRYKAHSEIASYMYPKVKSFEAPKLIDNNLKVTINIAGYAQSEKEIPPDDIEVEFEKFDKKRLN